MSKYFDPGRPQGNFSTEKRKPQKKVGCKKCGKNHADGCFDINGAVRRQFIKEFTRFMED